MLSIHDNWLLSFSVQSKDECIVFHTLYNDAEPAEYTDVVFRGVCAYAFEHDLMKSGNILFGIEPLPLDNFVDNYRELFSKGKNYGWPGMIDYNNREELLERLSSMQLTPYEINASLGLSGFVLAKSMELVASKAAQE